MPTRLQPELGWPFAAPQHVSGIRTGQPLCLARQLGRGRIKHSISCRMQHCADGAVGPLKGARPRLALSAER